MLNESNLTVNNKRNKKVVPTPSEVSDFFDALDNTIDKVIGGGAPEGLEIIHTSIYYGHIDAIKENGEFLALVGKENYEVVAFSIALELEKYEAAQSSVENIFDPNKAKEQMKKDLNIAKKFKQSLDYYTEDQSNEIGDEYGEMKNPIPAKYALLIIAVDTYMQTLSDFLEVGKLDPDMIPLDKYMGTPKKTKTPLKNLIAQIIKKYNIENYSIEAKKLIDLLE